MSGNAQKIALITGSTDGLGRALASRAHRSRSSRIKKRQGQAQEVAAAAGGVSQPKPTVLFDREYYRRYYYDPRTAVTTRREMHARASLIAAFTEHVGLPVRRILDAGCGTGLLRAPLERLLPKAGYVGLETSTYLCSRYGWEHGRIEEYRGVAAFDLVICYDVLQYLGSRAAARAVSNLGRLCRGVLYFSALTRRDWEWNCDRRRTDPNVHLRAASWYRPRLQRNFREIGAGFWLRRGAPLSVWELESQF